MFGPNGIMYIAKLHAKMIMINLSISVIWFAAKKQVKSLDGGREYEMIIH